MKYNKSFSAIILIFLMGSCKKVSVNNELQDTYVQFNFPNTYPSGGYATIKNYYFSQKGLDIDTIYLPIKTLGLVPEKQYEVKLEQIKEAQLPTGSEHAIPNVHYVDFSNEDLKKRYLIAPETKEVTIPLVVKRDVSMRGKIVQLSIKIAQSKTAKPGLMNYNRVKILISGM
ncbi:DUF4843 domain-containing protein [Sphingobacterium sp. DR205]|uniref:DUF4843 domain-containing protein n=1 Tax=Sphingobacterium sp. DR205 TaxID=2713573 RepID=UPI0013E47214|nr:DUF4843 domain-containing protein [Sphingobacterium sp. DR205]QIH35943.1 DUF4843 domain-containing protein [Sphingobacterium sp. DR205]